jgi:hypothetical protein
MNGGGGYHNENALDFAINVQTVSPIGSPICPTRYEGFALEFP